MNDGITGAFVLIAIACLWVATRPAPPARARRALRPPANPDAARPVTISTEAENLTTPSRRGWGRQDLQRAVALDLVVPGAEADGWPPRGHQPRGDDGAT